MADVAIVGAGVMGASIAFHLVERGLHPIVLDRGGPLAGSTPRSAGIVIGHGAIPVDLSLAQESLTTYFERWGDRVGGGCGFTRTGSAILVGREDLDSLRGNVAMLKEHGDTDIEVLTPDDLAAVEPEFSTEGIAGAAYESRGGYADPTAATLGFLAAATRDGAATVSRGEVVAVLERRGRVVGVQTTDGPVESPVVVLACGAWSVPLAETVGLVLPIRPSRIHVTLFQRPYNLLSHLTMSDIVNNIYGRPTADRCTLVGLEAPHREWLTDPDDFKDEPDPPLIHDLARRLARRIPKLVDAPYRLGRTGVLDMTPDGHAILGPEGPSGLFVAVGWSGSGFGKAPAVGAEMARWITDGAAERPDLRTYDLARFDAGRHLIGQHEYSSRDQRLGSRP